jgi:PHD/YefM family antitoxin component YafN of YafNO toxin-antitoxin module
LLAMPVSWKGTLQQYAGRLHRQLSARNPGARLITRRHAQDAVVMSLDTYNSLMETVHLLRSPANAAHLQRSLEQADRGELLAHPLIDADPLDASS